MTSSSTTAQRLSKRAQALKTKMNAEQKSALAIEMGGALDQDSLNEAERLIALEIIEKLILDEMESVRIAVAESVAASANLPGAVAQKLARDIEAVAIPVLKFSPVLEDKFLFEIINSGITEKINAIAERQDISSSLSRKIVSSGKTPSVIKLLNNKTSHIADQTIVTIIRVYGDHHKIEQALFDRNCLNDELVEILQTLTEGHVSTFVKRYFNLPDAAIDVEKGKKLKAKKRKNSSWWDGKKGAV